MVYLLLELLVVVGGVGGELLKKVPSHFNGQSVSFLYLRTSFSQGQYYTF